MNNFKIFVLDTSAWLTLIEDEQGAERVEAVLTHNHCYLPFPVLMEVYYISLQEQGQEVADKRYAMMLHSGAEVLWNIDEPLLLTAARLKAKHRISLGDALIAAFAARHSAILLHKDPEYDQISNQVILEALPYKR